jgi:hypothetical protein
MANDPRARSHIHHPTTTVPPQSTHGHTHRLVIHHRTAVCLALLVEGHGHRDSLDRHEVGEGVVCTTQHRARATGLALTTATTTATMLLLTTTTTATTTTLTMLMLMVTLTSTATTLMTSLGVRGLVRLRFYNTTMRT